MKMFFTSCALSLYWMLTLDIMFISVSGEPYELNLADNSVDDMYHGCKNKMDGVIQQYKEEIPVWKHFEECAKKSLEKLKRSGKMSKEETALTKDHLQAICMYTDKPMFKNFNADVREKGKDYGGPFQYHILHFYLTSAIQTLNSDHICRTTYRRTRVKFTGKVGQIIRFGSFGSSSFTADLKQYGSQTCFKIETCLGAPLEKFSVAEHEKEVLIPPYEMFVITELHGKDGAVTELADCEVVFVLASGGLRSSLNCGVFRFLSKKEMFAKL